MAFQISFDVDPSGQFKAALERAKASAEDLREAMQEIADDYYEGQRDVFEQSPGIYPALTDATKKKKQLEFGFIYPILVASGRMKTAASVQGGKGNITKTDKTVLTVGVDPSTVSYADFHQMGTRKMKQREFLFIGPESQFSNSDQKKRPERWAKILFDFVVKKTRESGMAE